MTELMHHCLLVSDNLYAESFMKRVAVESTSTARLSYTQAATLTHSHLPVSVQALSRPVDGSGLSRHDLVAPRGLRLLFEDVLIKHGYSPANKYVKLLPIGGVSG